MKTYQHKPSLLCVASLGALLAGALPALAESPSGCSQSRLSAGIGVVPQVAHIGDVITFSFDVTNDPANVGDACDQKNVVPKYTNPSGTVETFATIPLIQPGQTGLSASRPYTVLVGDIQNIGGFNVVLGKIEATGLTQGQAESPSSALQTITAVIVQPKITIDKSCRLIADPNNPGQFLVEATVTISNTGDVNLINVQVKDDNSTPGVPGDDFIINTFAATLAKGASSTKTYTYTPSGDTSVNTVVVTATDGIVGTNAGAGNVTATDNCSVELPKILVEKTVACLGAGGTCDGTLTYGETAAGVKVGSENPAFCYRIRVVNTGGETINSVTLSDNVLGNLTAQIPAAGLSLIADEEFTIYVKAAHASGIENTVTVTGIGASSQTTVTDTDVANVTVSIAALTCEKQASVDGGTTWQNSVEIPQNTATPVLFRVIFHNTGNVSLNVTYSDSGCGINNAVVAVANNSDVTVALCTSTLTCTGDAITNTVTWSAAFTGFETQVCANNLNGQPITLTGNCTATVTCKPKEPCISRTIGYWFNHVLPTGHGDLTQCVTLQRALNELGGTINLGFITLPVNGGNVLDQTLGLFWGKRSVAGDGYRDSLCHARKRLAIQLIGAIANVTLLNEPDPITGLIECGLTDDSTGFDTSGQFVTGPELIDLAQQAAATCDIDLINHYQGLLDAFNNLGDDLGFPDDNRPCPVGRTSKDYIKANQVDPTKANPDSSLDPAFCGCNTN